MGFSHGCHGARKQNKVMPASTSSRNQSRARSKGPTLASRYDAPPCAVMIRGNGLQADAIFSVHPVWRSPGGTVTTTMTTTMMPPAAAKQQRTQKLFVFGDDFADTGNGASDPGLGYNSREWRYPFGMSDTAHARRPSRRFSDGLVQSDFMAKIMGHREAPPPYTYDD
ncbi:hypothetical protein C2845_PM04G00520 [Panicum miliaceum]|uniref:Uncharacterized protein n=1 Tax=Panicum miliaceum TaxID=4540 RepID=A0A3L6QQR9_PANMI|nr:hypothetical protein C2845_PM04G00520 [Panicum miliaceum]